MGEVMQSLRFDERSWREIEAALKTALRSEGMPVDAIDWICRDLKPRYLACSDTLTLSVNTRSECLDAVMHVAEKMKSLLHSATTRMLFEMAKLEAELYAAKCLAPQNQ